jgi:hypothetical protein
VYFSPSYCPYGLGPPHPRRGRGYKLSFLDAGSVYECEKSRMQLNLVGARLSRAARGRSGPLLHYITALHLLD